MAQGPPFEDRRRRSGRAADPGEITRLLGRWVQGDAEAKDPLLAVVYDELRRLAGSLLVGERTGHSLQPTDLVHELYMKLDAAALPELENRRHFFGIAARAMRQLLVDHARFHGRGKRLDPGAKRPLELAESTPAPGTSDEVLAVNEALEWLAVDHPRYAEVVELRYFGGFSLEETAEIVGVGRSTAARDWVLARALLQERLGS